MIRSTASLIAFLFLGCLVAPSHGQPARIEGKKQDKEKVDTKTDKKDDGRLPHTKLMPARRTPDLCVLSYRVSTASPACQAYFDQGLGYYYSYVWMEAARSFETAVKMDPDCAL